MDEPMMNNNKEVEVGSQRPSYQGDRDNGYDGGRGRGGYSRQRGGFRGGNERTHMDRGDGYSEQGGRRIPDRYNDDKPAPPPDFGDRYSANRSRDQHRRQQYNPDWNKGNDYPDQHNQRGGGRGGYNNRGRYENYRNNNSNNPMQQGPRFSRGSGGPGEDRFDASQPPPPPRFHQPPPPSSQQNADRERGASVSDDTNLNNLPPRFNKKISFNGPPPNYTGGVGGVGRQGPPGSMPGQTGSSKDVELSLRPASGNMLFKPKTPSLLPKSAIGSRDGSSPLGENSLLGPMQSQPKVMMQQKEASILIKQGSLDGRAKKEKNRQAANKGPTREEVFAKVNSIISSLLRPESASAAATDEGQEDPQQPAVEEQEVDNNMSPMDKATASWLEDGWLPSKMTQTAVTQVYNVVLQEELSTNRQLVMNFLLSLVKDKAAIDGTHCREAFTKALNSTDKEASKNEEHEEKVSLALAELAAWKVRQKLACLDEVADCVSPTLNSNKMRKILLQTMSLLASSDVGGGDKEASTASGGKDYVLTLFNESKIQLKDHVDESEQSDAKLAQVLASYKLSFLKPMLFIRQEMTAHVAENPDPEALLNWINGNVSADFLSQPDFIIALYSVVLGHIVETTTLPKGCPAIDVTSQPEKSLVESEKDKLTKFRGVLHSFVANKADLQLTAVYALQVFSYGLGFPKGLLLRAFVNCYELDILDEHAFLQWKEDVNDFYPGKGQALFQVNQWLTWLEEAESEEEDEDDD